VRGVCAPDPLAAQLVFEQSRFQKFDHDQFMAMNLTRHAHQQKREQRRHGTHATVSSTLRLNFWKLRRSCETPCAMYAETLENYAQTV
jgi:hypothetical protein